MEGSSAISGAQPRWSGSSGCILRRSIARGRGCGRAVRIVGLAVPVLLHILGELLHGTPSRAWVGATLPAQAASRLGQRQRQLAGVGPLRSTAIQFDATSVVDVTEEKLLGTTLKLTASVFGFPDFPCLVDLTKEGRVRFYGGMVSKEPGYWCVEQGNRDDGERPDDLYLEFTQPLTERYVKSFTIPGGKCIWRGKLNIKGGPGNLMVNVDGGIVVSERNDGKDLVREGVFRGVSVDEQAIQETRAKNKEAFERALTTPKGESTGFKTPARIAGAGIRRPQRQLAGGQKKELKDAETDLEDD